MDPSETEMQYLWVPQSITSTTDLINVRCENLVKLLFKSSDAISDLIIHW